MKITLLSRSREAKTLLRCRTLRDANKDSKSTCSSLESRGRRSSMTFWREKDHRSVSSHRPLMLWEQGPDRYFSSSQALPAVLANTTCCSALKHKPSKGLPQIVLPELSRVHLNVHSMGPTTSMPYWAEGRELFIRRKTSLCPTRNGFQAFWHSGSRVAQSLYHFHSYFYRWFLFLDVWPTDHILLYHYRKEWPVNLFLCSQLLQ